MFKKKEGGGARQGLFRAGFFMQFILRNFAQSSQNVPMEVAVVGSGLSATAAMPSL